MKATWQKGDDVTFGGDAKNLTVTVHDAAKHDVINLVMGLVRPTPGESDAVEAKLNTFGTVTLTITTKSKS